MLRFYFVISISVFTCLIFAIRYSKIERHSERYTDRQRYALVRMACRNVQKKGRITDEIFGLENLPTDGGYVMYSNHQGRYDALGILLAHDEPCTFIVDKGRSEVLLLDQITTLLRAKRLDKTDIRGQVKIIDEVADEVSKGRKYLIFPEGGYPDAVTDNSMREFMPGAFKAATKAKSPIVPICLYDSYKVFLKNSLKKVRTQIHFLEPIMYDEYKDMNTHQIAELVKNRIQSKLDTIEI